MKNIYSKPLFNMGPHPKYDKKKKKMSTKTALKTGINPWGDADRDGYINMFDCRPFDQDKHSVYAEDEDRPVPSYIKPKLTYGQVFQKGEQQMKMFTSEVGEEGGPASDMLTQALRRREEMKHKYKDIPIRKVVGTHDIHIEGQSVITPIIKNLSIDYLNKIHPEKQYRDTDEPDKLVRIDTERGTLKKVPLASELQKPPSGMFSNQFKLQPLKGKQEGSLSHDTRRNDIKLNITSYRRGKPQKTSYRINAKQQYQPPWYIADLAKHLSKGKPMKMYITDEPIDVLQKSKISGYHSCETAPSKIFSPVTFNWTDRESIMRHHGYELDYDEPVMRYRDNQDREYDSENTGEFGIGPFYDVANRNAVAYIYKKSAKIGKDTPSGRTMIRWGHLYNRKSEEPIIDEKSKNPKMGLAIESGVYGLDKESDKEWIPYLAEKIAEKKGANLPDKDLKTAVVGPEIHGGFVDSFFKGEYPREARDFSRVLFGSYDEDTWEGDYETCAARNPIVLGRKPKPRTQSYDFFESIDKIRGGRNTEKIPESIYFGLARRGSNDINKDLLSQPISKRVRSYISQTAPSIDLREDSLKGFVDKPTIDFHIKNTAPYSPYAFSRLMYQPDLPAKERKKYLKERVEKGENTFIDTGSEEKVWGTTYNPQRARIGRQIAKIGLEHGMATQLSNTSNRATITTIYEDTIKNLKRKNITPAEKGEYIELLHGLFLNYNLPKSIIQDFLSTEYGDNDDKVNILSTLINQNKTNFITGGKYHDIAKKIFNKYKSKPKIHSTLIRNEIFNENTNEYNALQRILLKSNSFDEDDRIKYLTDDNLIKYIKKNPRYINNALARHKTYSFNDTQAIKYLDIALDNLSKNSKTKENSARYIINYINQVPTSKMIKYLFDRIYKNQDKYFDSEEILDELLMKSDARTRKQLLKKYGVLNETTEETNTPIKRRNPGEIKVGDRVFINSTYTGESQGIVKSINEHGEYVVEHPVVQRGFSHDGVHELTAFPKDVLSL